jgi:predicted dehydrogenase
VSAPIRAAVVGVGFGRAVLLPALKTRDDVDLVAVCSAHKERADAAAAEYGVRGTDDVDALIDSGDVDLLLVSSPPRTHAEIASRALDNGLHVYSTKPLALELADAKALWELANRRRLVTAMDFDMRFIPAHRFVRRLVRDGYLGELRLVVATMMWPLGTDPRSRLAYWGWPSLRAEGGIARTTMGPHMIDLIRFMFGDIESVSGIAATMIREKPVLAEGQEEWGDLGSHTPTVGMRAVDAEDTIAFHGRIAGGGIVTFTGSSAMHHGSGIRFEAYGSEGTLVVDSARRVLGASARDVELAELDVPESFGGAALTVDPVRRYEVLLGEMAAAIRGESEESSFATFEDGLRHREIAAIVRAES